MTWGRRSLPCRPRHIGQSRTLGTYRTLVRYSAQVTKAGSTRLAAEGTRAGGGGTLEEGLHPWGGTSRPGGQGKPGVGLGQGGGGRGSDSVPPWHVGSWAITGQQGQVTFVRRPGRFLVVPISVT